MKKILLVLILLVVGGCANATQQPKLSTILNRARYIRQQGYSKDETYTRILSMFNEIYGYEYEKEAVKLFEKFASEKVDLGTPDKAVVVMNYCYATIAQKPRNPKTPFWEKTLYSGLVGLGSIEQNTSSYPTNLQGSFVNPQTGRIWVRTGDTWMDINSGDMLFVTGNSIMDAQTGELSTILNDGSIMNLDTGTIFQKTGNGYMNMDTGELTFILP